MEDPRGHVPGANLLQITWEHMTVLSAPALAFVRDMLLRYLGQHSQLTAAFREAEALTVYPAVSFLVRHGFLGLKLL